MKDILKFLDTHYDNALKLVSNFDITKSKKWEASDYVQELLVQVGHVYTVLDQDDEVKENKRIINNLGDELADVLLQLINLARIMNIDMHEIQNLKDYKSSNVNGLSILMGQLAEVIMENNSARFKKNRVGFETSYDFIKDRIFKLFIITYNIGKKHKLNLIKEFSLMCEDANGFLERFRKGEVNRQEYIDIYDENEDYLGYCEKNEAHRLGYWHRVFGCLIFNSKTNKVFMQVKNPNHNGIHKKALLEITVGGHLITGETPTDGVREIKEETGLDIDSKDLRFIEYRRCNKTIKSDYKIKEFQYYYSVDIDKNVTDFKDFDKNEVLSFVEVDKNDLIKLINKKITKVKARYDNGGITNICYSDLDKAFINNGLYISLLNKLDKEEGERLMDKKLKKLYKLISSEKRKQPESFYFDDGKVVNTKDFEKDFVHYSVMKVQPNVNCNEFLVYILIVYKDKPIPQMLLKKFKTNSAANKYFDKLSDLIEKNTSEDIINTCYYDKFDSSEKVSVFKRIFG